MLIVEDDLPTRELYVFFLTKAGFTVRAAHNGRQALDACRERRPDAVLVDLRLPGLDGFELTQEVRLLFAEAAPPLIAVTGHVPADDDVRLERARFHRLLVKPVAPALLVEAVTEALNARS